MTSPCPRNTCKMRAHMLKPKHANVGWAKVMPVLSCDGFQKPMMETYADLSDI